MTSPLPAPGSLVEALGPPPFRFTPSAGPVMQGAAFSFFFKLLTVVIVVGIAAWFFNLWLTGRVSGGLVSILTWFLAGLAMMAWTGWNVLRSVTRIDSREISQTWVWPKKIELRELAFGKVIRVRGLEWVIAPRLYVRTLLGKFAVFYAADKAMLLEFERLVGELKAFRDF